MHHRTFSTFHPPLRCGNARDMENQRFTTSLWKTLRVYHIPTTASILYYSCVKIYADLLRKRIRLLTTVYLENYHLKNLQDLFNPLPENIV